MCQLISFGVMQSNTPLDLANSWLSLDEAASYIGSGKTVLYALARDGRIPANKVGKKWAFERTQLDLWLRSNKPLEAFFADLDFNIESNASLREPQREGYSRVSEFFTAGKNKAILQIPVGCG